MPSPLQRYARQMRLAEIGEAGQASILEWCARIPSGYTGDIAALYLRHAGMRVERDGGGESVAVGASDLPESAVAKQFAEGAWLALAQINLALGKGAG